MSSPSLPALLRERRALAPLRDSTPLLCEMLDKAIARAAAENESDVLTGLDNLALGTDPEGASSLAVPRRTQSAREPLVGSGPVSGWSAHGNSSSSSVAEARGRGRHVGGDTADSSRSELEFMPLPVLQGRDMFPSSPTRRPARSHSAGASQPPPGYPRQPRSALPHSQGTSSAVRLGNNFSSGHHTSAMGRKRVKLLIPAEKHPEYNFVGRLLGPRGTTLKTLERETGCKIMIRGMGSIRKDKEADVRGKPGWEHVFSEPLHVVIEVSDAVEESSADLALERARDAVQLLLVPVPEERDGLKRQQLRDLAILNGTFRGTPGMQSVSYHHQHSRVLPQVFGGHGLILPSGGSHSDAQRMPQSAPPPRFSPVSNPLAAVHVPPGSGFVDGLPALADVSRSKHPRHGTGVKDLDPLGSRFGALDDGTPSRGPTGRVSGPSLGAASVVPASMDLGPKGSRGKALDAFSRRISDTRVGGGHEARGQGIARTMSSPLGTGDDAFFESLFPTGNNVGDIDRYPSSVSGTGQSYAGAPFRVFDGSVEEQPHHRSLSTVSSTCTVASSPVVNLARPIQGGATPVPSAGSVPANIRVPPSSRLISDGCMGPALSESASYCSPECDAGPRAGFKSSSSVGDADSRGSSCATSSEGDELSANPQACGDTSVLGLGLIGSEYYNGAFVNNSGARASQCHCGRSECAKRSSCTHAAVSSFPSAWPESPTSPTTGATCTATNPSKKA